ncbi:uncharacterized protein BJ212DRAFT_213240 [Suillus subaureus]|uniref:Uncharacterized protein n=1 Tax=Suillus subaureus TaxID=48587 RepID=A0A9P7EAP7_9AGAM|nr:uncharacterized protein BJ212DRAFT_213240 [Suillus subaureus]KAG1816136.1 hypothetical protein BJ212DRAFT_213240 [Suillus subaureus]
MSSNTWTTPVTFLASPNTAISLAFSIRVLYATRLILRTMSDWCGIPRIGGGHSGVQRPRRVAFGPLYLLQSMVHADASFYFIQIRLRNTIFKSS